MKLSNKHLNYFTLFTPNSSHLPIMSESTFHPTREDIRKSESQVSRNKDGEIPPDSEPSQMKAPHPSVHSVPVTFPDLKTSSQSSTETPNPNPKSSPSVKPTFPSPINLLSPQTDASKVNVGSGRIECDISHGGGSDSLRGPATSDSSVRTDGEQFNKHLGRRVVVRGGRGMTI